MSCCCVRVKNKPHVCDKDIATLMEKTKFTKDELHDIYIQFIDDYPSGHVTLEDLTKQYQKIFPRGNPEPFSKKIFRRFDLNNDGVLDYKEFIIGLDLTSHANTDAKLQWAFSIYDEDDSGFVDQTKLLSVFEAITTMMGTTNRELATKADKIFHDMDVDNDGVVSVDDFVKAVKRDNTLIGLLSISGRKKRFSDFTVMQKTRKNTISGFKD